MPGEIFGRHLEGIADDHVLELTHVDRKRIFNLGYYTWVEQQGVSVDDFERRRHPSFWDDSSTASRPWDRLIEEFNAEVGGSNEPHAAARTSLRGPAMTGSPYLELREQPAQRDRSLREKVVSLEEAASFVNDGDAVGIGGSTMSRTPMAMIWALIRAAPKGAVLLALHHLERRRPAVRLRRLRPHHHELVQPGHPVGRLEGDAPPRRDRQGAASTNGATWRWACVFARAPWACRSCRCARCWARTCCSSGPEADEIDCPFTGEKLLLVPALNPDVALIHVQRCDRLRQRADRRPAVHGHRSRDGREPRDPHDRAHRLERSDPPRAGSDQDSVLLRSMPWSSCRSDARRTNATASTSR